jgi:two-component system phosphate regulon sensor histidine kinase PhoR
MNVIGEFIVIANKKGVILDIKDIDNTVILGDSTQISVFCSNLIDNAIKYTPKGKTVSIKLKDSTITVKDEGIGIEKKNLEIIFDRFFRVYSGRFEGVKGYGLGLSMVKIIANLHKADIDIQSEVGFGTKIEVRFPTSSSS